MTFALADVIFLLYLCTRNSKFIDYHEKDSFYSGSRGRSFRFLCM